MGLTFVQQRGNSMVPLSEALGLFAVIEPKVTILFISFFSPVLCDQAAAWAMVCSWGWHGSRPSHWLSGSHGRPPKAAAVASVRGVARLRLVVVMLTFGSSSCKLAVPWWWLSVVVLAACSGSHALASRAASKQGA